MLNHHDKLTIRMIEQQMKVLHQRKASDTEMLEVLSDFAPDVKYILAAGGIKEIRYIFVSRFGNMPDILDYRNSRIFKFE